MNPILIGVIVFVVVLVVYFLFFNSSAEPPAQTIIVEEVVDDADTAQVREIRDIVRDFSKNAGRGAVFTVYELDEEETELLILKKNRDGVQLDVLVNDGDVDFTDAALELMKEWEYPEADGELETEAGDYLTFYTDETHADLGELCEELLNDLHKYELRDEVGLDAEGYNL